MYNFTLDDLIQATWFAGSHNALTNYYKIYYNLHDERIDKDLFVGKEQPQMSLVIFGPERSGKNRLLNSTRLRLWDTNICADPCFFYQKYFTQPGGYKCDKDRMSMLQDQTPFDTMDRNTKQY